MLSPIVIRGSSEEYGSWKTIWSGRGRPRIGTGLPVEQDPAAGHGCQPDRGAGQRGLAGPGLPHQPDDLARRARVRLTPSTAVVSP